MMIDIKGLDVDMISTDWGNEIRMGSDQKLYSCSQLQNISWDDQLGQLSITDSSGAVHMVNIGPAIYAEKELPDLLQQLVNHAWETSYDERKLKMFSSESDLKEHLDSIEICTVLYKDNLSHLTTHKSIMHTLKIPGCGMILGENCTTIFMVKPQ